MDWLIVALISGAINVATLGAMGWLAHKNGQLVAALNAEREAREKDVNYLQQQISLMADNAKLEITNALQPFIDTRQRWTLTYNQLVKAEAWIIELVAQLEDHEVAVPPPPDVRETHRPDESKFYPVIDEAREIRLKEYIRAYIDAPDKWI
ncbi:hypothetical protein [Herpetosiphon geysericola]|nr:hypothetical protein [Herpetosiphon geysericola]